MDLKIYTESLCPFCKTVISDYIVPRIRDGLLDMVNLTIIPYGNEEKKKVRKGSGKAWYDKKHKNYNSCQHGFYECQGNKVENCFIHHFRNDKVKQLKVLGCLENEAFKKRSNKNRILKELEIDTFLKKQDKTKKKFKKDKPKRAYYKTATKICSKRFNYSFEKIWKCVKGKQGYEQIEKARKATHKNIDYTPYIELNGKHVAHHQEDLAYDNLYKFVCDKFKGKKPAACAKAIYDTTD